ncbi:MAG TPA: hypothetical protein VK745_11655 [Polyangiaceae bacterium]|jgi:hypothetical protein|nr:hypothetical protein [Polyangiaceae bacterium]
MEDKKPKIDLKSRLGKKTVSSPAAGSIPPPAGIPKPSIGVPNPSRVPAPPFAAAPQAAAAQRVDASNPYGAMEPQAAPIRIEPTSIKIEMSDEFVAAQKSGRTKVLVLCIVTAGLGGALGFAGGGISERNKAAEAAVEGAGELTKKVDETTAKANELADILKSAKEKLTKATFPDDEVSKLGGINLPFSAADLSGKGIGRFNAAVISQLIDFSAIVDKVNDEKEKLGNMLTGNKKGVQDFLDQTTKPQVRWSVVLGNGPAGPWATMQPVATPFLAKPEGDKAKWPDDIHVPVGDKQAVLKRYSTGNPISEDGLFIPVDPGSQAAVCPSDVLFKLRRELGDLEEVLRGNQTPGEEKTGLLEAGQNLSKKLKQIGAATP